MQNENLTSTIKNMPKVELHVHLKGATRPETILKLAAKNNIELPAKNLAEMATWFEFKDFAHFIGIYSLTAKCFAQPEDVEFAAREFLTEQARQNIIYTELTYTVNQRTMPFDLQLEALNRAKAWGEETLGVSMNYVIDIPRNFENMVPSASSTLFATQAVQGMGKGVVGLGLAGNENTHMVSDFSAGFNIAKEAGLPIVPHAGEAAGPQSMLDAIEHCDPPRIGHGVRCIEDKNLMALLKERQIHLEISPTSNICLGIFDEMANHSFAEISAAGIPFSINSDDPPYFNTTLTDELIMAARRLEWSAEDVQAHMVKTAEATLLSDADKSALIAKIRDGMIG
jgi:adenosine deaminase